MQDSVEVALETVQKLSLVAGNTSERLANDLSNVVQDWAVAKAGRDASSSIPHPASLTVPAMSRILKLG
jgi:hypothetical protein